MSEVTGKRCAKCYEVVGYRKEGKCCGSCRRPVHHECIGAKGSTDKSHCCAECGVTTHCDLCEQEKNDAMRCYLRVQRTTPSIGAVTSRWVNLQCNCCAQCLRKGNRVRWSGVYGVALMFGLPVLILGAGIPVMEVLFGKNGALSDGLFGIPAKAIFDKFPLVALVSIALAFISSIPLAGMLARRRMKAVYKPALDQRLRAIAGVRDWGAFANVSVFRKIPDREVAVPLN
jgi:hypothetical protein